MPQRPPLHWAYALGATGVVLMAAPRIDRWLRSGFADRLAAHAATAPDSEARLAVRRLAGAGPESLAALVRLAGSANPTAAEAAQDAVLNRLAGWDIEFRVSGDDRTLARRLDELSTALAASAPQYDSTARPWARRAALQIVALSDALPAETMLAVLTKCDGVLAASAPERSAPAPRPVVAATHVPATAPAVVPPATPIAAAPPAAPSAAGDLHVVDQPTPPLAEPTRNPAPVVAQPTTPVEAPPSPKAKPLPLPDPATLVVEVPSPLESRRRLRYYRQLSDRDLSRQLMSASGYDLLAVQQVLRERQLPDAARPTAPRTDGDSQLFERVGKLPAAAARTLLRELVADETEEPDIRLEALTLLATSGDPQLAEIARRRALEDADPRVADLATKILRDVRQ